MGSAFRRTTYPNWFISAPIERFYHLFGFYYANLWNERLKEIIEGAISGGIIKRIFETYTKSEWNLAPIGNDSGKLILNFDDLILAFQICLIAFYAAFVIFLIEVIVTIILKICKDGWDSMQDDRLFKIRNRNEFSSNITSCSQSIYSSTIADLSSIASSPIHRINIALDVDSIDSDSVQSIGCSIAFGDAVEDDVNSENSKARDDGEFDGTGGNDNGNPEKIEVKIEDFD